MRYILGIIFGTTLTIAFAFLHDSMATSSVAGTSDGGQSRAIVNWEVVKSDWRDLKANLSVMNDRARESWAKFTDRR